MISSEQMYKKRLRKWNIRKRAYRRSPPDSEAASPAITPGSVCDEESAVEEVPRSSTHAETTMSLIQPSRLEPYAGLEVVLDSIWSWSNAKLDTRRASSDPMSMYLANPNMPPIQDSRTMYRMFELVFDLWFHGKGHLAGMAARKAFYVLEFVLTEDHPDCVWHILDTIYDMVDKGHLQLLGLFLDHANFLAHKQLPANHPLLRIVQQLRRCDYQTDQGRQEVCHLLRQGWLSNVDLLGEQVKSPKLQQLWLYEQLIWDARTRLRKDSGLARKRETMIKALEQLRENGAAEDEGDYDTLRIEALKLEYMQMDLGDRQEAERLALDMLRRTAEEPGARSSARFHAYARKMLARLYEQRQDFDNAEENFQWAIAKREAAHGTNNNLRVIRDMWVLAAYFQRVGREEDARRIADDAIARAQQYLEDAPG